MAVKWVCVCVFVSMSSNRGSLLGNFPGELEMMGSRPHSSRTLLYDHVEDPVPKMRRTDDDRPALMRSLSPDYNRHPNYMEEEQDRYRSDRRAGPVIRRIPEDRDDRQRKVVSIFDIDDRLRREDVDQKSRVGGGGGYRRSPEHFDSRRDHNEEMLEMQLGRPLGHGPVEPRMGSWDDGRAVEREQPMPYERRVQEDRRLPPPKTRQQIPSLVEMMDREYIPDRRQQRMPDTESMMMADQAPKRLGHDRPGSSAQDDFKQSTYYQNESGEMQSGRPGITEHASPYSRDRDDRNRDRDDRKRDLDDRNRSVSDRMDRFGSFVKEEAKSTARQSSQPAQSSEQSDPVSLLLNLSQLLA